VFILFTCLNTFLGTAGKDFQCFMGLGDSNVSLRASPCVSCYIRNSDRRRDGREWHVRCYPSLLAGSSVETFYAGGGNDGLSRHPLWKQKELRVDKVKRNAFETLNAHGGSKLTIWTLMWMGLWTVVVVCGFALLLR
jgi:hypothetical protein